MADVYLQLADGTYATTTGFSFGGFTITGGHRLYVQGNTGDMSKVVFQCSGACCTSGTCKLLSTGTDGVYFYQITVSGAGCTGCVGMLAGGGGTSFFSSSAMSGVVTAFQADGPNTWLYVYVTHPSCAGVGPCFYTTNGAFITTYGPVTGNGAAGSIAVYAESGSINAAELNINNFDVGIKCSGAGSVYIPNGSPAYTSVNTHCSCSTVGPQSC